MMKRTRLTGALAAVLALVGAEVASSTLYARESVSAAATIQAAAGNTALGTVRIPKRVMANGQPLAPGSYQVRLTGEDAGPAAKGATQQYERWVEFVQGGKVVGREVASVVPQTEIKDVATDTPPGLNAAKVETLKGDDYVRVWIRRPDNHYLIHLVVAK